MSNRCWICPREILCTGISHCKCYSIFFTIYKTAYVFFPISFCTIASCFLYKGLSADWLVREQLCSASLISWLASSRVGATEVCPIKLSPVLKYPAVLGQRPCLWPKIEEMGLALFQTRKHIYSVCEYPEDSEAQQGSPMRHLHMWFSLRVRERKSVCCKPAALPSEHGQRKLKCQLNHKHQVKEDALKGQEIKSNRSDLLPYRFLQF